MSDHHDCQHDHGARHGARLEDGAAHAEDHLRWNRRDFLVRMGLGTVGATFLAGSTPIGVFGSAPALDLLAGLATDRVLVLIQLGGGNDGLNTVVPIRNDVYYQRRPNIGIPEAAITGAGTKLGSSDWGLHPSLLPLMPLWDRGDFAVTHAVGYRTQSRSHFEGIDNWFTGSGGVIGGTAAPVFSDGWAGRYLLGEVAGDAQTYAQNPPAISLGSAQRLFDTNQGNLGVGRLTDTATAQSLRQQGVVFPTTNIPTEAFGGPIKYLRDQANVSLAYVVRFADATNPNTNPNKVPVTAAGYGTSAFAQNLALAARIVRGGLSPRIISVTLGGFDTHSAQAVVGTPATGTHATLMGQLAQALKAFFDDLKLDGLDQRVVAMTFSEFGRTLYQNASAGTDHGTASPVLLAGPSIAGGQFGMPPNLVNDLTGTGSGSAPSATTDYRNLYATLLERWFGVAPAQVDTLLGASFTRMGFLAPSATGTDDEALTAGAALLPPSPNPFHERSLVRYRLAETGPARLRVYDGQGRLVATLADGILPAGDAQATLDGSQLAAGLYVIRLETARGVVTRPVVRVH